MAFLLYLVRRWLLGPTIRDKVPKLVSKEKIGELLPDSSLRVLKTAKLYGQIDLRLNMSNW